MRKMDEYPFDLGAQSWPIDTHCQTAQRWFDRAMAWLYGYNHEEALLCFEQALTLDPNCAMAQWGIAYAVGPNYNRWWISFTDDEKKRMLERAHEALRMAAPKMALERGLIDALKTRYPSDPTIEDFQPFHDAYAQAMKQVFDTHRDDLTVTALYVESLMNRTPWLMWDITTAQPHPNSSTKEAQATLEAAFERKEAWTHPGLLHLYIHLMEMSPTPELALPMGDALGPLIPDAGHLWHMPTHVDVICGRYKEVIERNQAGIDADEKYRSLRGGLGQPLNKKQQNTSRS